MSEQETMLELVRHMSGQIDSIAASQEATRAEIRAEVASMRNDVVTRREHEAAIGGLGRSLDMLRIDLAREVAEREKADDRHAAEDASRLDKLAVAVQSLQGSWAKLAGGLAVVTTLSAIVATVISRHF